MSLRVAIQMDPIETISPDLDSTFLLASEANKRGHTIYHYLPSMLTLRDGYVSAKAQKLSVNPRLSLANNFEVLDFSTVDVVLMRQDPPFNMSYITATHILQHIQPHVLIINDPGSVRNSPEKLFAMGIKDLMPPTIITSDFDEMIRFRNEFRDIIVKPLYGNGGDRIFHITESDENFNSLINFFHSIDNEPIIIQKYLAEVRNGDKRIILIDGEPVGAVSRVPPKGDARSNIHVGGTAKRSSLNDRDREICSVLGPMLQKQGLLLVGIDVIGQYLTEVNVTSPTGLQEINRFDNICLESKVWDSIEQKLQFRDLI